VEPNPLLNEIPGLLPSPSAATGGLIDNWQTAFLWLATGIVVFALITLYFGFKRALKGEHVNKGMLPYIKWPLLFASAGFNIFFTYYVFLPAGQPIALFAAIVMGGVNLAEAYLVRLIIATWRHDMKTVFRLAFLFTLPVFLYSLMAAGSSFSTMMHKNKDSLAASQLELQAAQDRIKQADAKVNEARIGAEKGDLLQALYQTEVRNSRGVTVPFGRVRNSCGAGGYYALHYPELCRQYTAVSDGVYTASNVASASTAALGTSAQEKLTMAQIIKDRPPQITPTLLGFGLSIALVGFIVSLALESAIVGVGFFEELFIKPTPLPGLVRFMNKALDWNTASLQQRGLQVDISPSPGTINFSTHAPLMSPFSDYLLPGDAPVQNGDAPRPTDNATDPQQGKDTSATDSDPGTGDRPTKNTIATMLERMQQAAATPVGETMSCATCGQDTLKRTDTKRFCSNRCRRKYHKWVKE
jgi:hypothetical protein